MNIALIAFATLLLAQDEPKKDEKPKVEWAKSDVKQLADSLGTSEQRLEQTWSGKIVVGKKTIELQDAQFQLMNCPSAGKHCKTPGLKIEFAKAVIPKAFVLNDLFNPIDEWRLRVGGHNHQHGATPFGIPQLYISEVKSGKTKDGLRFEGFAASSGSAGHYQIPFELTVKQGRIEGKLIIRPLNDPIRVPYDQRLKKNVPVKFAFRLNKPEPKKK